MEEWNRLGDKIPTSYQLVWMWRETWSTPPKRLFFGQYIENRNKPSFEHWVNSRGSALVNMTDMDWWYPWNLSDDGPPNLPVNRKCN